MNNGKEFKGLLTIFTSYSFSSDAAASLKKKKKN